MDGSRPEEKSALGTVSPSQNHLTPDSPETGQAEAEGGKNSEEQNAVSLLQEDIQRHSSFFPHTKILSWSFQQRIQQDEMLQFRAVVSFVFGEVPHHFCGDWQTSKKKAQRDTAERVRKYLECSRAAAPPEAERERPVTEAAGEEEPGGSTAVGPPTVTVRSAADASSLPNGVVEALQVVINGQSDNGSAGLLEWQLDEGGREASLPAGQQGRLRATVVFLIHGLPHRFCGSWCDTAGAARIDTAERVLWYFQKSDQHFAATDAIAASAIAPPALLMQPASPSTEAVGLEVASPMGGELGAPSAAAAPRSPAAAGGEPAHQVEDKTILMQVQNELQKVFAKETPPGQKVWTWEYEPDKHDPQLFRAHVKILAVGRLFEGDWCRGKKTAQRNTCLIVKRALDAGQLSPR